MLDRKRLQRRVLLDLLTSPWTLAPITLGITLLAGALAFSRKPGMLLLAGLASVLAAAGTMLTRWLFGTETLTRKAMAELQQETLEAHEQRMDELDRRLAADQDPRTEAALRDLRAFERAFRDESTWGARLDAASRFDIVAGLEDLFDGSVKSLETADQLWETASGLQTTQARRAILDRREELIGDVQASIEQLGRMLVGIQRFDEASGKDTTSALARIRTELDENLAVAEKVHEKMRTWQSEELDLG